MYLKKIILPAAAGGIITLALLLIFPELYRSLEWRLTSKNDEYHKAANGYLLRMDKNTAHGRLVFIGDSHIESMDISGFTPRAINFGIGNDTWFGISQRIPSYTSLARSKAIIFLAGVNDLRHNSVQSILQQAEKVITRLHSSSLLYIVSVPPIDTNKIPITLEDIQSLNTGFAKLCQTKCTFINIYNPFLHSNGTVNTTLLENDGIHLNNKGYEQLKKAIQLAINKNSE